MLKFAIGEIRKHRTPRDLWIAYQNKVYDLSAITEHDPELLQALAHRAINQCNEIDDEQSKEFEMLTQLLAPFQIGILIQTSSNTSVENSGPSDQSVVNFEKKPCLQEQSTSSSSSSSSSSPLTFQNFSTLKSVSTTSGFSSPLNSTSRPECISNRKSDKDDDEDDIEDENNCNETLSLITILRRIAFPLTIIFVVGAVKNLLFSKSNSNVLHQ